MESQGRAQDQLGTRMALEWFWFLLSHVPIFSSCNGGWAGGPPKTLSLGSPHTWGHFLFAPVSPGF